MKNFYLTRVFLTLTIAFILIAVAITNAQTTYYVTQTGNDGLSGTSEENAWQSLTPVNNKMNSATPFLPGDKILFERGSQFYGTIVIKCSGSDVNPIVFGAYGTGSKPIFKAAAIIDPDTYKDVLHSNWKYEYGRIWSYKDDLTGIDVANLIFTKDGNTITGRKIMNSSPSFSNHGDFWYDFVNDRILIYSEVGNPTDFYDMIQTVQSINAIEFPDDDQYIVFENLDFRYFGNCVVEQKGSNCTYKDLDISFIGGVDLSGDYSRRHGHGLQMWNGVHDVTITSCTFDNIYESGVAIAGENHSNINIKNNVITNCEYSLEFWNTSTSSNTHSIFIEHNTCVNAGGGWGHNQRDDVPGQGTNFIFGKMQGSYSNISVQSNIFCGSTDRLFWIIYPEEVVGKSGFTIDNNCFYKNNNEPVGTLGTENIETLALWQIATGFETNSVDVNPLFVSFSDFHLQYNSPLIGFGIKGYAGSFNPFNAYDIVLSSQADVNAFNYNEINGNLYICGFDINDLSPLLRLTHVYFPAGAGIGNLNIVHNNLLTNLDALQNLTYISEGLNIRNNAKLTNIDGLKNLNSVGVNYGMCGELFVNDLKIYNNPELERFCGLYNLFNGGQLGGVFEVHDNAQNPTKEEIIYGGPCTIYEGDLILSSQAEVDAFYFTEITGSLTISGADIVNLAQLSCLTTIGGGLKIEGNPKLNSLYGLNNLNYLGHTDYNYPYAPGYSLVITHNDLIANLDGIQKLTSFEGGIKIQDNAMLVNLNSLKNLNSIGYFVEIAHIDPKYGFITGSTVSIDISRNAKLTSIDGLQNLTSVGGGIRIIDNASLKNLDGFQKLTSVGYCSEFVGYADEGPSPNPVFKYISLRIINNTSLSSFCGLYNLLCSGGELPGKIEIYSNAFEITPQQICDGGPCGTTIYNGDLVLSSQAEVDLFHYTEVTGSLTIDGENIEDLTSLLSLTTIGGELKIMHNSSLPNLFGLKNLNSLGADLTIYQNNLLNNLEGLENLNTIGGALKIEYNASLYNLFGCQNLTSLGTNLVIYENYLLDDLDALGNLNSIGGDLLIYYNTSLNNIEGLHNLTSIPGALMINRNASLSTLNGLQNIISVGKYVDITANISLTDVDGLNSLTFVEGYEVRDEENDVFIIHLGLQIFGNSSLTNLDGLEHLYYLGGDLVINYNVALTGFCGLYPLLSGEGLTGILDIENNAIKITKQQIITEGPCNSIGNTQVYNSYLTWGNQLAMPVTINIAGEIVSIAIYHDGGFGNVLLGVYSDQGGFPSSKLGVTASSAVNSAAGWQTIQLSTPVPVISGQTVWLSWVFQNSPRIRYAEGTPGRAASTNTWADGLPASFGPSTLAPNKYSIYCTLSTENNLADAIAPVVTVFDIPSFSSSLTIPINSFTATDNTSVAGYLLNEWAAAPLAGDAGWCASAPVSYTFTTAGTKTLFAWAKDAAGNVSESLSAQVIITLPSDSEIPSGNTNLYSNTIMWGNQLAMPVTINMAGEIESIAIYHEGGNGNVLLGVYSDLGGFPSSKLGITASTAVNPSAGWQTIQLSTLVPVISGQTVWLSWVFQNSPRIRYTEGTPGRAASSNTWADGMPASFGPSTLAPNKYSIYCTLSTENYPADAIAPVVTMFDIPPFSSSLTIPINSFTVTDNASVAGYLLTESATIPLVGDAGWSASAPVSFTFTNAGAKILYAWAKDAAGNVSSGKIGYVKITLPLDSEVPIGNTGLYSNSIMWGNQLAMPVMFTEAGEIKSISIYHEGGFGNVLLGIYSDQGGFPSSKLGVTASTVVNPASGWQTIQLLTPVHVISGQTVWLSWVFQNSPRIRYTSGTPGRAASTNNWTNQMPSAFGASTIAPTKYSIYCTYTVNTKSAEITTAITPETKTADLKVYPNPFSDRLHFEFVFPESVNARIDVYDMTGRLVKTVFEHSIEGGIRYEVEFKPEMLISGMYFYRVVLGKTIFNGKVIYKKE